MGPSLNLKSHQAGDMAGINGHNLRRPGHTSASIDPALSGRNKMLDRSMTDWTPPAVQPDTGRKIRADARVAASFVMTLPEELDHARLDAWVDASMTWFNSLPGKTAYAVLHLDEPGARPHIHAVRIPVNEAGNLNYKRDFGGHRERLDEMHADYALALEPLGVLMAHEDDRKKRRSARQEPDEPNQTPRPGRRRPKTRAPETPRAKLVAEVGAAKALIAQQAQQQQQLQASLADEKTAREEAEARALEAEQEVNALVAANREARRRLKASGQARQEDYQALKAIRTDADRSDEEKIKAIIEYADARLRVPPAPAPDVLADLDTPLPAPAPDVRPDGPPPLKKLFDTVRENIIEARDMKWRELLEPYLEAVGKFSKLPAHLLDRFNALLSGLAEDVVQEHQFGEGLQSGSDKELVELRNTLEQEWLAGHEGLEERQQQRGEKLLDLYDELDRRAITAREQRKPIPPLSKHRETILGLMQPDTLVPEPDRSRGYGIDY
jgi:hypothetical protein